MRISNGCCLLFLLMLFSFKFPLFVLALIALALVLGAIWAMVVCCAVIFKAGFNGLVWFWREWQRTK